MVSDAFGVTLCVLLYAVVLWRLWARGFTGLARDLQAFVDRLAHGPTSKPVARPIAEINRQRLEVKEHAALDERTWQAWGHLPTCWTCLALRVATGETTAQDYLLRDSSGRPFLTPSA